MKNLGQILLAILTLVSNVAIAQGGLQTDLRYFPQQGLRQDIGYVFATDSQQTRLLEPYFLSYSFGRPSNLWSGLVRERGETVQLASFPTNAHQTINHGLTENYLRILIHNDLHETTNCNRSDARCNMSVAAYSQYYFNNAMNPELTYSTWAYKINSASLCFGIDPLVFAGLLVKESKLRHDNERRRNSGTGYTQMTDDGIREVEHQMYPDLYRNVSYTTQGGRRYQGVGWSISEARISAQNQISNADCYWGMVKRTRSGYQTHSLNPTRSAAAPGVRERPGYFGQVQDWLLGDVDRQIVYGAALFKAKLVANYRAGRTPFMHYQATLRGYNGHARNRRSYSESILEDYPALLGINITNTASTYDQGVTMAFRREVAPDTTANSRDL